MSAFSVCSLFSGSTGNATYIRAGETELLIDAGVSASAICRSLNEIGTDISRLSAILVTHEHCDHVKGLEVLSKKHHIPVHMTAISVEHMRVGPALCACLERHEPQFELTVGDALIKAFPVPHDSACCVGYRIEHAAHAVAIATDMGRVTKDILPFFLGTEAVIVESNHDIDLLLQNPHYPSALKERILSGGGHLSNELCARFLAYLAELGTHHALLAHLSKENNTPALAEQALTAHLHTPLTYRIAAESTPTLLL